jgi:putative FmdB family regulatory protein
LPFAASAVNSARWRSFLITPVLLGRRMVMPQYEYFCDGCNKEVTLSMSMSQHDKGGAACPNCGGGSLRPLVGNFFSRTSRTS